MITIIIVIHFIVSFALIFAILLHSGKGTGLSNAFGGAAPSTFGGTSIIEKNLDRITIGLAIVFTITSIILSIYG